jgi:hypothetical protein
MEAELGTAKVRVSAYIDEEQVDMTKAEFLTIVNEFHEKLQAKQMAEGLIQRMVGFGR